MTITIIIISISIRIITVIRRRGRRPLDGPEAGRRGGEGGSAYMFKPID